MFLFVLHSMHAAIAAAFKSSQRQHFRKCKSKFIAILHFGASVQIRKIENRNFTLLIVRALLMRVDRALLYTFRLHIANVNTNRMLHRMDSLFLFMLCAPRSKSQYIIFVVV